MIFIEKYKETKIKEMTTLTPSFNGIFENMQDDIDNNVWNQLDQKHLDYQRLDEIGQTGSEKIMALSK